MHSDSIVVPTGPQEARRAGPERAIRGGLRVFISTKTGVMTRLLRKRRPQFIFIGVCPKGDARHQHQGGIAAAAYL